MQNADKAGVDQAGDPETDSTIIPIVAVGASAGGLAPIQAFLKRCPEDSGCAFVVLQHLPPDGESELADVLSNTTELPVCAIEDKQTIAPNQVYVL